VISIIKQIQVSITGEAKWLRWVWRKCKRKAKYTIYRVKAPTLPQTKARHKLPLKSSHGGGNTKFQTQGGSKKSTRFLNAKDHTPLEPKTNQTKHQIQPKTPTPPEDQMSLDKPQDTHKPLKQQNKSMHIWPRHKSHKSENNHQRSQAKFTRHPQQEKCGPPQQLISKQG
jgi:hypothetical protein